MGRDTRIIYGLHAVRHELEAVPEFCLELWVHRDREDALVDGLRARCGRLGVAVHDADPETLDKLVEGAHHQGVVLRRRPVRSRGDQDLDALIESNGKELLLLALDGVEDPNNLGACLRTAEAAGVDAIVTSRNRGAGLTAAVYKVASGAADRVPLIRVANLARALARLRKAGVRVIGAASSGESIVYQADLRGPLTLVVGGEERGLRDLTAKHCDQLVRIPMHGYVESLNVSVSTGIVLFEAVRQRKNG